MLYTTRITSSLSIVYLKMCIVNTPTSTYACLHPVCIKRVWHYLYVLGQSKFAFSMTISGTWLSMEPPLSLHHFPARHGCEWSRRFAATASRCYSRRGHFSAHLPP